MAKRANRDVAVGQEILSFDGPLRTDIGFEFNETEAQAARKHRMRRRGELALNARTVGFMNRVGGLWIPCSESELSAVVKYPILALRDHKEFVRQKVFDKYEGDRSVSEAQVMLWAHFAATNSERDMRDRYRGYVIKSEQHTLRLRRGLLPSGEIERARIESDAVAFNALAAYLVYLRTFVGAPGTLNARDRRKWPQHRHVKKNAERLDQAYSYLDTLPEYEFAETVREAYWSARSRNRFWTNLQEAHKEYLRDEQHRDKKWFAERLLPIKAYAMDPQNFPENYIDLELID